MENDEMNCVEPFLSQLHGEGGMSLSRVTIKHHFLPMTKEPQHPADWCGGPTASCDQSERRPIGRHRLILARGRFTSKVFSSA